ncbi:hypothetical protein NLG97_g7387 [Lecanicillium saksenae]|uniref:Uncharacterized protein n=1 Tax=Lecanicillium saksenae TaxID=468837 RepID=A0ACC1QQ67_9HYPO|nr:hypothetical protein NLG97_g7387 [Lecanicillium saksenae]
MDGLSAAASVIAVLDISIKVTTLISKYANAVAGAQTEISNLRTQIKGLETTLGHARALIEMPQGKSLVVSRDLKDQLSECFTLLQKLQHKLEVESERGGKRKFWMRSLRWPFSREEIEVTITSLDRYNRHIMNGLLIDNTSISLQTKTLVEQLSLSTQTESAVAKEIYFMVPFPSDPNFVARPAIQNWIQNRLDSAVTRVALIGMGGFGKSQIAIEIAYAARSWQAERSIYWVHAHTKATFEESYRSIANRLELPSRHDPNVNVMALVRDSLQRDDASPWLMILDNADDLSVFYGEAEQSPLASFLPNTPHGKILVTSRNLNVAERLTGSTHEIKRLETMDSDEAVLLLRKKLGSGFDEDATRSLVNCLDCIPLAVSQAAAYINRRRISIDEYINRFQNSEQQRARLLAHDGGDIRRHDTTSNAIATTWLVTFQQIRQESPAAANLLSLLSCFQPQNIPRYVLSGYDGGEIGADASETLEDDMDVLFAYSLVGNTTEPHEYEMHSLVQICTRAWLADANQLARWNSHFLQLTCKHFPNGLVNTWPRCQLLLPHIERVLYVQPETDEDAGWWAWLLLNVSRYMRETGDFYTSVTLARKSVEAQKKLLGSRSIETLEGLTNLAIILSDLGHHEESLMLSVDVARARKNVFGVDDIDTLASMNNLGLMLKGVGRLSESEKVLSEVFDACRTKLGPQHSHTVASMMNLAVTYMSQGRWAEARNLHVQVLEIHEETLDADDPLTLNAMHNLAQTLQMLGSGAEAMKLQTHVVRVRSKLLGEEHPETLESISSLAWMHGLRGSFDEAEAIQLQAIAGWRDKYGAEDLHTIANIGNLAGTYRMQGRWDEAERISLDAMKGTAAQLGADHPDTLKAMDSLALAYHGQGRLVEARATWEDCYERRVRVLGAGHSHTRAVEMSLANVRQEIAQGAGRDGLETEDVSTNDQPGPCIAET